MFWGKMIFVIIYKCILFPTKTIFNIPGKITVMDERFTDVLKYRVTIKVHRRNVLHIIG